MDIYDLDGTILDGNSFESFTLWLVPQLLKRGSISNALYIIVSVATRKCRLISHLELKRRVVRQALQLSEQATAEFVRRLVPRCERRLARLRLEHGRARISVLATAAPDCYATALARALAFDHVVASGFNDETYVETRGAHKRDAVVGLAVRLGVDLGVLFTDHVDDIPLADRAGSVVLVDAGPKTLAEFRSRGTPVVAVSLSAL